MALGDPAWFPLPLWWCRSWYDPVSIVVRSPLLHAVSGVPNAMRLYVEPVDPHQPNATVVATRPDTGRSMGDHVSYGSMVVRV